MSPNQGNIQAYVRIRPNQEKRNIIEVNEKEIILRDKCGPKTYTVNKVFKSTSNQDSVYKKVVHPLIKDVFNGYSCTVFVYGQSGSGKTYTMLGEKTCGTDSSWEGEEKSGLIPRSVSHIFDELQKLPSEYAVQLSFIELYNEELVDLFSSIDDMKLRLYDDTAKKGTVIVSGLEEVIVQNKNEAYKLMEKGCVRQQTRASTRNCVSSQLHTVFTITVRIKDNSIPGEEFVKMGKLCFVDLAGSENGSRSSGLVDKPGWDTLRINLSLLTLGRVVNSLVSHDKHIPYRESKLTRLLQDSLGGSTKTCIIATVYPTDNEETLNTLDFLHKAKNVVNCVTANKKLNPENVIKKYTEEIVRLRKDLAATREKSGTYVDDDNYAELQAKVSSQEEEILKLMREVKSLKEESRSKELEAQSKYDAQSLELEEVRKKISELEESLLNSESERGKLVEARDNIQLQLQNCTAALKRTVTACQKYTAKYRTMRDIERSNSILASNFKRKYNNRLGKVRDELKQYPVIQVAFIENVKSTLETEWTKKDRFLKSVNESAACVKGNLEEILSLQQALLQAISDKMDRCSEKIHDYQSGIMESLKSDLLPTMESSSLKEKVTGLVSEIIKMQDLLANSLTNARLENSNTCETFNQYINQLRQDLEIHRSEIIADIQAEIASVRKQQCNKVKEIDAYLTSVNRSHEKLVLHLENSELEQRIRGMNMRNLCANHETVVDNITRNLSNVIDNFSSNIEMLNDFQDGHEKENDATFVKLKELFRKRKQNLEKFLVDLQTHKKHLSTECVNIASRGVETFISNQKRALIDKTNQFTEESLVEVVEKLRIDSKNQLKKNKDIVEVTLKELQDQSESVEKEQLEINAKLDEQSQLVDSLMKEELQKDKPTGETPQRQDYRYPQNLSVTSPYERLKQRFRNTMDQTALAE